MRYTERGRERQRHRQREKQAPCREPDVGLDPWTPGSGPGPKAGAKLLSQPGVPHIPHSFKKFYLFIIFLKKIFIYPFMRDTQKDTHRDTGRGRNRLHTGSLMWDLIPGLQDQALGRRQALNR